MTFTHCVEIGRQKAIERMTDVDEPEVFAVGKIFVVARHTSVTVPPFVLKSGSKNSLPGCAASL